MCTKCNCTVVREPSLAICLELVSLKELITKGWVRTHGTRVPEYSSTVQYTIDTLTLSIAASIWVQARTSKYLMVLMIPGIRVPGTGYYLTVSLSRLTPRGALLRLSIIACQAANRHTYSSSPARTAGCSCRLSPIRLYHQRHTFTDSTDLPRAIHTKLAGLSRESEKETLERERETMKTTRVPIGSVRQSPSDTVTS